MSSRQNDSEKSETIRVGENTYIPTRFVDEDGDVLEYDGISCWIAKDDHGEIIKKASF